ncbi:MAG: helix-turn-helix domain-containing protein [Candidatus Methanomethyliaceae archaeon]
MERAPARERGVSEGSPWGIDPDRLYPLSFAADRLSVSEKLIRWWIRKGVIEGVRLPNRAWRVRGIEIIALIERGRSWKRNGDTDTNMNTDTDTDTNANTNANANGGSTTHG